MPRLSNIDDILFPVDECSVYVNVPTASGRRRVSVPEKKAIINTYSSRVLRIVSRDYRLVTNREALELAYQCCQTVFPNTRPDEWEVKAADAPSTGGHCFIDLAHNSTNLDFSFVPAKDRPDAYGPFIRVTNSYNTLRTLGFDIGFFRKVCKNGLIVPDSIIRFKFIHSKKALRNKITFDIAHTRLTEFKNSFREYLGVLRDCYVSRSNFEPFVCKVLRIRKPKKAEPESPIGMDWQALIGHLVELSDRYSEELGENAYAVFNAMTELSSHPPRNRCIHRDRNSYQRLVGNWLSQFSKECRKEHFSISSYLISLNDDNSSSDSKTDRLSSIQSDIFNRN